MIQRTPLIPLALLALGFTFTFAGCSKPSSAAATARPHVYDLGVVEVSDGVPSRHDLGGGRVCIATPTVQKDGTVLIAMRVEEAGKLSQLLRVQTRSDMPFQISVGDLSIGMNPHIKP